MFWWSMYPRNIFNQKHRSRSITDQSILHWSIYVRNPWIFIMHILEFVILHSPYLSRWYQLSQHAQELFQFLIWDEHSEENIEDTITSSLFSALDDDRDKKKKKKKGKKQVKGKKRRARSSSITSKSSDSSSTKSSDSDESSSSPSKAHSVLFCNRNRWTLITYIVSYIFIYILEFLYIYNINIYIYLYLILYIKILYVCCISMITLQIPSL